MNESVQPFLEMQFTIRQILNPEIAVPQKRQPGAEYPEEGKGEKTG